MTDAEFELQDAKYPRMIRFRNLDQGSVFGPSFIPEKPPDNASRQVHRAALRSLAFYKVSELAPANNRRIRRELSKVLLKQYWSDLQLSRGA